MEGMQSGVSVREDKIRAVAKIQEKLNSAKVALVTDYRGLTVPQMARLRRDLHEASGEYKVFKNTLARRALKDTIHSSLDSLLEGPIGWVFGYEDPVILSKALTKFIEDHEKLSIKGGLLDGQVLDEAQVKQLAKMPSKQELQAKLLALLQAPATQLLRLIQEPGARTVRLLEGLRKDKEQSQI